MGIGFEEGLFWDMVGEVLGFEERGGDGYWMIIC